MNLKKAFELLDEDKDGKILYDVKKISKIKKKKNEFGKEAVIYESDISNVSCFICPSSN